MSYTYTYDWFLRCELRKHAHKFVDANKANSILEIGSFEGLSACFFMESFMDHPDSTLTCVDPFLKTDETTEVTNDTKSIFYKNVALNKNVTKIRIYETFSHNFFDMAYRRREIPKYDFVYIDGSHLLPDITVDLNHCIHLTKRGGIIWMDDYGAGHIGITEHIDRMYEHNKEDLELIHKEYQIAFRKK
jgi:predicted O-methyltransferase YrrM